MDIEVFHTSLYQLTASAVNPDLSVFAQHTSLYALESSGASPDSVFIQQQYYYELSGGIRPFVQVNRTKLYSLEGLAFSTLQGPAIMATKTYQINGGSIPVGIHAQKSKLYMITV